MQDSLQELENAVVQGTDLTSALAGAVRDLGAAVAATSRAARQVTPLTVARSELRQRLRAALDATTSATVALAHRHLDVELCVASGGVIERISRAVQGTLAGAQPGIALNVIQLDTSFAPLDSLPWSTPASGQIGVSARCSIRAGGSDFGDCRITFSIAIWVQEEVLVPFVAKSVRVSESVLSPRAALSLERHIELALRSNPSPIVLPTLPFRSLGDRALRVAATTNTRGAVAVFAEMLPHDPLTYVPLAPSASHPNDEAIAVRLNTHALGDAFEALATQAFDDFVAQHPGVTIQKFPRVYSDGTGGARPGIWFEWIAHYKDDNTEIHWPFIFIIAVEADGAPIAASIRLYYSKIVFNDGLRIVFVENKDARTLFDVDRSLSLGGWGATKDEFWVFYH